MFHHCHNMQQSQSASSSMCFCVGGCYTVLLCIIVFFWKYPILNFIKFFLIVRIFFKNTYIQVKSNNNSLVFHCIIFNIFYYNTIFNDSIKHAHNSDHQLRHNPTKYKPYPQVLQQHLHHPTHNRPPLVRETRWPIKLMSLFHEMQGSSRSNFSSPPLITDLTATSTFSYISPAWGFYHNENGNMQKFTVSISSSKFLPFISQ